MAERMRDDAENDYVRDVGAGIVFMAVTRDECEERAEAFCRQLGP